LDLESIKVFILQVVYVGFFFIIVFLLLMIFVMVGVAFLTLLEGRVLVYIYIRNGPNKVGFGGILQPFRDAIRLSTREQYFPLVSLKLCTYKPPGTLIESDYHMLHVYNCVLLKMSTCGSKHVEEINIL